MRKDIDQKRYNEFRADCREMTPNQLVTCSRMVRDCPEFRREAGLEFTAALMIETVQRNGWVPA